MTYVRRILRRRKRDAQIAKQIAAQLANGCRVIRPLDPKAVEAIGIGVAGMGGAQK